MVFDANCGASIPKGGEGMKRLLVVVGSALVLMAAGATGALAGEVKGPPGSPATAQPGGNPNDTAAPDNANSNCAYSGLNDYDSTEGQLASQVQTAADSWKYYGLPKGAPGTLGLCKGGTNEDRSK
jgi:hypothetical protein